MMLLGIDGGGTETKAVLTDENGKTIAYVTGGPSNPNGQTADSASNNLISTVKCALNGRGGSLAVFAGIAGCSDKRNAEMLNDALLRAFPGCISVVTSDTVNALSAGVGPGEDGMIAICGTGSSFFAREHGVMTRTGGWGYLFGDEGSGYAIGREAVIEIMKEADGFPSDRILTSSVKKKLASPVDKALPDLYASGRTGIASYAVCVAEAALNGSARAGQIISANAAAAAAMIRKSAEKCEKHDLPVVTAGSMWTKMPLFFDKVRILCPDTCFVANAAEPVAGSVYEAAALCGIKPDNRFKSIFSGSFAEYKDKQD